MVVWHQVGTRFASTKCAGARSFVARADWARTRGAETSWTNVFRVSMFNGQETMGRLAQMDTSKGSGLFQEVPVERCTVQRIVLQGSVLFEETPVERGTFQVNASRRLGRFQHSAIERGISYMNEVEGSGLLPEVPVERYRTKWIICSERWTGQFWTEDFASVCLEGYWWHSIELIGAGRCDGGNTAEKSFCEQRGDYAS